jgi:hypothetical protein
MRHLIFFLSVCSFAGAAQTASFAQAPDDFSFHGRLTDDLGNPIDTVVTISTRLFSGDDMLHEQIHENVEVADGAFSLIITDTDTVSFDRDIEIAITVGDDPQMTPNTKILMAPYAQSLISFRVYPVDEYAAGPNLVGGHEDNFVEPAVSSASVLGGGQLGYPNAVGGNFGTVAGGRNNRAEFYGSILGGDGNLAEGSWSTVAGGSENSAFGQASVIGGGYQNKTTGAYDVIPGGKGNVASGFNSFAAGEQAAAKHNGAFVWQDASAGDALDTLSSTGANQFLVRASGGVTLLTTSAPDLTTGAFLAAGGSGWAAVSSKSAKQDFVEVDPVEYLEKVVGLDIQEWRYKTEDPNVTHVGPVAEEFFEAFGHGPNTTTITTTDVDGVALVAIQGLYQLVQEQAETIAELKARLDL